MSLSQAPDDFVTSPATFGGKLLENRNERKFTIRRANQPESPHLLRIFLLYSRDFYCFWHMRWPRHFWRKLNIFLCLMWRDGGHCLYVANSVAYLNGLAHCPKPAFRKKINYCMQAMLETDSSGNTDVNINEPWLQSCQLLASNFIESLLLYSKFSLPKFDNVIQLVRMY